MYIVTIQSGDKIIPIHNGKETLASGKITKGINTIDSFQFTMLPSNQGFGEIYDYTTFVKVYNKNRNRYDFYGRVLYSNDEMSESGALKKEVICESYLGFLCDSQQEYVEERNWRVGELLEHIVNMHNSQMESYKQFTVGEITVTDPNDNIYCGIQRTNTWEALNQKLIDVLGGEIRFRVVGDKLYLDYLTEIGEHSNTEIALSHNMKSIAREKDPTEIITRLIPLGAKRKAIETDENGNESEVETEYRIDISSANNGKNYIDDELAMSIYGIRVGVVEFDEVENPSTLLVKGEKWLKANNKIKVCYTVSALDLSLIGEDSDDFEVCNHYKVKNPLLDISDKVRVIKKNIDVCEPTKTTLEFGDNFETLTESMKRQSDALGLIVANYVTNKRFANAIAKTSSLIEQTEEKIRLEVKADYEDLSATLSEIKVGVGEIELSVNKSVDKLGERVTTNEASIKLLADSITSTVTAGELGTAIIQNAESVRIAWNHNSKYISFENGELRIYNSEDQEETDLLSKITHTGTYYYNNGVAVGKIGTSGTAASLGNDRALVFTLDNNAHSMAWTRVEDNQVGTGISTCKWMYSAGKDDREEGIHFCCSTYSNNHLHLGSDTVAGEFKNAAGEITAAGLYSESTDIALSSQGSAIICGGTFELISSSALINVLGDIDMNGYEVLNQSDARLKTNIADTSVKAVELLSQVEMKQFDWIDSGEHCEIGVIAQQLREVAPDLVHENEETGKLSIKPNKIIPYLIKAIQELAESVNGKETKKTKWTDKHRKKEKEEFVSSNNKRRQLKMSKGKGA